MRSLPLLLGAGLFGLVACAHRPDYVEVKDVALGRVVVYRNGVAYYERRATVEGDELTVQVPQDKVDDFLKSLTVVDAASGKPLPVSFPTQPEARGGVVEMAIQLPKRKIPGKTDLLLTYITEAPAWKPSYRVVVEPDGKVLLQGWAVVDNTSGEDWNNIYVGVGSSSALSFRYDLWSIRSVHREMLAGEDRFAVAPPMGGSPYTQQRQAGEQVVVLADSEIPRPVGHPDAPPPALGTTSVNERYYRDEVTTEDKSGQYEYDYDYATSTAGDGGGGGGGGIRIKSKGGGGKGGGKIKAKKLAKAPPPTEPRPATTNPADTRTTAARTQPQVDQTKNLERVRSMAQELRRNGNVVVIEGYADAGEADANNRALDRANTLRNKLIDEGVPPAQVRAEGRGVVGGQRAGVRLVVAANDQANAAGAAAPETDVAVGESHFNSVRPMDVRRGTSVMVSIVRSPTEGEIVYLFDPESARGNSKYAFRAVRFRNPTVSTLETGPLTVYGEDRFIGEGLSEPIPPKATAVVPFALDRQVVITSEDSGQDRIESLITLSRGILTANVQHAKKTKLKVTNRLPQTARLFIRHTVQKGWTLTESPKDFEVLGDAHLFEVEMAAGETKTIDIEEATPIVKTVDLRTDVGLELIKLYMSNTTGKGPFAEQMQALLALHKELTDHAQTIESVRQRLSDYRERMDELHLQIVTLEAVKTKGELMNHLKTKMKDISERVQKATIELVDLEEKMMTARIRFQDGVAELSLEDKLATTK